MSEQHVPTTEEVRELIAEARWRTSRGNVHPANDPELEAIYAGHSEFQLMCALLDALEAKLAARDAEIAAKALEEAASALREYGWGNPARMIYARAAEYRKEVQGD